MIVRHSHDSRNQDLLTELRKKEEEEDREGKHCSWFLLFNSFFSLTLEAPSF